MNTSPLQLSPEGLAGSIRRLDEPAPIADAVWYEADFSQSDFAVLEYALPAGGLAGMREHVTLNGSWS